MNQNLFYRNPDRFILLSSIKGLIEESKRTRRLLDKSKTNQTLHILQDRKRKLSYNIRYRSLAYGFLRGKKYQSIENKCDPGYKPDAGTLYATITHYIPLQIFRNRESKWMTSFYQKPSLEDVKIWLMPET